MKNNLVITVLVAIVIGGVGFFAGMKYQQSKSTSNFRQFGNGQGFGMMGGQGNQSQGRTRMNGARQVTGEILNQDDKSITVKLQDGSTRIIFLSDTTTISKATTGSKSDLKVGERVGVFGTENSDGSVTAQNVQLNPTMRGTTSGNPPAPSGTPR
jgi:hypothetical protein